VFSVREICSAIGQVYFSIENLVLPRVTGSSMGQDFYLNSNICNSSPVKNILLILSKRTEMLRKAFTPVAGPYLDGLRQGEGKLDCLLSP